MLVYDITLAYLTILYGLMSIITVDINVMVKSHFKREIDEIVQTKLCSSTLKELTFSEIISFKLDIAVADAAPS